MRRGSQEPRRHVQQGQVEYSEADDAIALGEDLGIIPFPWQRSVLGDWCSCRYTGKPSFVVCGLDVPRQNGKNAILEVYELYRLAACGWHILHTAHRVKTAKKSFNRLVRYFTDDEHPELKALVRQIRRTNGEEAIYLANGGSIEFIARTNGSARGFDDIQLVVYDEAQELTDEQYDAISYTLSASSTGERQTIYTGTPPNEACPGTVFARARRAALDGDSRNTSWFSWSTLKLPADDATFDDVLDAVYASNPSMGYVLDEDYTASEFAGGSLLGFAHERLGWWSKEAGVKRAISAQVWDESAIAAIGSLYPRKTAFGLKFTPDGSRYALAGCKSNGKGGFAFELIKTGTTDKGIRGLAEWVAARKGTANCVAVDGTGSADAFAEHAAELKAPRGYVLRPSTGNVIEASAGMLDALTCGRAKHTSQPELDAAAASCPRRPIGSKGGWGFGSTDKQDSAPLEACALALWAIKKTRRNPKRRQHIQ